MQKLSKSHPANIFSHCPSCGQPGFKFDNIKKFTCSDCNFKFYINAATAVAVILEAPDGKIALTKRKFNPRAGFYGLPGGFVDCMERAEDALRREVLEEVSVLVGDIKFLASFPNEYVFEGISYFTCDIAFVCPMNDLSNLKPADDVAEVLVVDPKEIDFNIISFPSIIDILKCYIKKEAL
jgi:NAD+ diphosphatase